jgi:hypothetical protein
MRLDLSSTFGLPDSGASVDRVLHVRNRRVYVDSRSVGLVGIVQHASDELRLSSVRLRRDVERRRRWNIQRDRVEFEHIDRLDIDVDRIDIHDDLKPDERLDDDDIHIK